MVRFSDVLLIRDAPAYDVHGGIAVVIGMIGRPAPWTGIREVVGEKKSNCNFHCNLGRRRRAVARFTMAAAPQ